MVAIVALAVIACAIAVLSGGQLADAQAAAPALGVDVVTSGNTANSLSDVEGCAAVNVGDRFTVDIFARDVQRLEAWELRFAYDHRVVEVVDHDYGMFLLSTAPGGSIFPSLFDTETPDRYFLAAAEFSGTADSGSGVLARITLHAVAHGMSPAQVVVDPGYFAPNLTTSAGVRSFSGLVAEGEIAVGQPCPGTSPTWVSAGDPSPAPGSSLPPNSSPDPQGSNGSQPGGEASQGTLTPTPRVAVLQTTGNAPGGVDSAADAKPSTGGSSEFPWWVLGVILGAVAAAAGGVALVFRSRS